LKVIKAIIIIITGTTISHLDSRTCICFVHNASERWTLTFLRSYANPLMPPQSICEPSHATNRILSARHALILMVSRYSDPVQAFENVIFWPYIVKCI